MLSSMVALSLVVGLSPLMLSSMVAHSLCCWLSSLTLSRMVARSLCCWLSPLMSRTVTWALGCVISLDAVQNGDTFYRLLGCLPWCFPEWWLAPSMCCSGSHTDGDCYGPGSQAMVFRLCSSHKDRGPFWWDRIAGNRIPGGQDLTAQDVTILIQTGWKALWVFQSQCVCRLTDPCMWHLDVCNVC